MLPSVDVVIPCYKYGRFLRDCVSSVLTQQGVDVRALVIDDASDDGSADIANALACEDKRIETIIHRANKGHIATYNEGIEWASSKYFLLLSADDLITPGCLERAVTIMEELPGVGMTHGEEINLKQNEGEVQFPQQSSNARWIVRPGIEFIKEVCGEAKNRIKTSTVVVRTELQKAVGGYRSQLPHAGDLEMWLRLASAGDLAETTHIQGIRRVHGANMSKVQFGTDLANFTQLMEVFQSFFENEGQELPDYLDLWELSRSHLAKRYLRVGMRQFRKRPFSRRGLQGLELAGSAFPVAMQPAPSTVKRVS